MYTALGHVVSTHEYGCRGFNHEGKNGANTFHLELEDMLAGGAPNNSFGQGKYLLSIKRKANNVMMKKQGKNWSN